MSAHKKVFLTGASGYVAAHVLDLLVSKGYAVKATVRSQDKADFILARYKGKPVETVIVPDIQDPHAFDEALDNDHDITAVLHTASPFFTAQNDPVKELLDPAIKGTTHVLEAIKKHAPQVTQVVITSSYAAISNVDKVNDHSFVHSEETWASVTWDQAITDLNLTYRASKKYAELAFWDFIKNEKPNFTGTTVNPPLIFGPLFQKVEKPSQINNSVNAIYKLLHSKPDEDSTTYSKINSLWADVRDVAFAHVVALEKPVLQSKRLFITPGFYSNQDILDIANKKFPELNGKIPIGNPGTGPSTLDNFSQFDNKKTNELTGIKYTTLEQSISDTIKTLLELDEKNGTSL